MPSDKRAVGLQWPACDAVVQRHPIQVLHHDEGSAFVLAEFVDGADVGMIERRGGASFAAETFQGLRVLRHFVRQELQSDEAA